MAADSQFVSRAGLKLEHAMAGFRIDATGKVCADLGCNAGGFTDCLLKRGAAKVYAVDTGYGMLEYKLRRDPRVVTMERTNAMHVQLPEKVQIIVIDVAWTKQKHILPNARKLLAGSGDVVTLLKPHYEAEQSQLAGGVLKEEELPGVVERVKGEMARCGFQVAGMTTSPIKGAKGNVEMLAWLRASA